MNHLSIQINPQLKGTLPRDTLSNAKNIVHCSGKTLDTVSDSTKEVVLENIIGENPKVVVLLHPC